MKKKLMSVLVISLLSGTLYASENTMSHDSMNKSYINNCKQACLNINKNNELNKSSANKKLENFLTYEITS